MDLSEFKEQIIDMYIHNFNIHFIVELIYKKKKLKSIYLKQKIYKYVYELLIDEGIYNLGGLY